MFSYASVRNGDGTTYLSILLLWNFEEQATYNLNQIFLEKKKDEVMSLLVSDDTADEYSV